MVFCPMTKVQMELYEVIVDKSIAGFVNEPVSILCCIVSNLLELMFLFTLILSVD